MPPTAFRPPTLCELTKNPRQTVSVRRDEGASEMGKNVRHLRIAAGLSQTALAERAGMNLSRLESVAKTLQVTPRFLV